MLEVKCSLPLAAGRAQRLEIRYYLPTQLQVDERSLPRERLLAGMVTHTRYQVRREGMALLASQDGSNPLVRLERLGTGGGKADSGKGGSDEGGSGKGAGGTGRTRPDPVDGIHEVKMFCNIFHSALKDELRSAEHPSSAIVQGRGVLSRFMKASRDVDLSRRVVQRAREYLIRTTARRLAHYIIDGRVDTAPLQEWLDELYEVGGGYDIDPLEEGHRAVMRDSALKKWVQSVLYLDVEESRNNERFFHVLAGVAAGAAMAFAVAATLFAEQRWAGGSLPWAIALVGAYIVKDRIKEMLRGALVRLVPGIVQDRVNFVYERVAIRRRRAVKGRIPTKRVRIARKVSLVRYPDDIRYRESEGWRAIDVQTRFHLKRRRIRRRRRVDAMAEIVRLDTSDWTTRMDRPWKEWPVKTEEGTLALRRIPRLYKVYVQVTVGIGRGSRDLRRRSPEERARTRWYSVTASRDRISSVKLLQSSPFR